LGLLFIVYSTGRCNLGCRYCGGSFDPGVVPWSVRYGLEALESIVGPEDVVAFYGGEPLLNLEFIREATRRLRAGKFVLQTNGLLLRMLDQELLSRFDTILVSIDGVGWLTDKYRGRRIYGKILRSVEYIRGRYKGDLVARMTVTEDSDIYRDVRHLLDLGLFDHVHWQLSLVWVERDSWRDLWGWLENSYFPGLKRLLKDWINSMRRGRVEGIAPFQGILKRIIEGGPTPPCGSGEDSFTILPDGRVVSCPIAVREEWANVGRLPMKREDLSNYKPLIGEPCKSCSYLNVCGGRCLYTHIERYWGEEGVKVICAASQFIIDLIGEALPEIMELVEKGAVSLQNLIYPPYNNTVEIMP